MLELKNIVKTYTTGDTTVHALDDVSVEFRKNEFVSILGPSGCGKTTMLNIIGGLDRYNSGDLIINGRSTKEYKDADWDNYRNHSIGFVFQSYNLIPHQTVLENVELALTLSGVNKEERKKRATEVLTKVGLESKLNMKPNQLSGGQMQRVAIARALVNDPEIILADEPTGALDTASSVQVMDLLKEISKDKLIIMVTHNPELAKKYSSRIVKLLDGKITDDSKPFTDKDKDEGKLLSVSDDEHLTQEQRIKKDKKKRMSFFMALSLSFKNLLTKKARTILVSFAGSIGIIGIALVLSLSSGFSGYIDKKQEDTLSNYAISIESKSVDFTSLVSAMFINGSDDSKSDHDLDGVYAKENISSIINSVGNSTTSNNLNKFYKYINDHYDEISKYVNAIQYVYNLNIDYNLNDGTKINASQSMMTMIVDYALMYIDVKADLKVESTTNQDQYKISFKTQDVDGHDTDMAKYNDFCNQYPDLAPAIKQPIDNYGFTILDSNTVLYLSFKIIGVDMSQGSGSGSGSGFMGNFGNPTIFSEMINNDDLIKSQYQLLGTNSRWPDKANEAILVLDQNNELDDYILNALGILDREYMRNILKDLISETNNKKDPIDYDSILGTTYKILEVSDYYVTNENGDLVLEDGKPVNFNTYKESDPEKYNQYYAKAIEKCTNKLEIVGIVRLKEGTEAGGLKTGISYTSKFTEQLINYHNNSAVVKGELVSDDKLELLDKETPSIIKIFINSFESKQSIKEFINKYNENAEKEDRITYTDYIDIFMSTVSSIIDIITYVLIAFISISLVVSSIMIGIITYISVIERTKEIGVLRSVGASKRDVKRVFTAESFIIGLASGVFGILFALLLTIPVNIILKAVAGISGLASMPWLGALILIVISVLLTLIAGIIPANVAAKQDPVKALRSE